MKRAITADDILDLDAYAQVRRQRRAELVAVKRHRRVEVGPFACFYFESFDTMLQQIQEMLYIENGGAAQLVDELAAYNPLIPQGRELVATMMLEIGDPGRRQRILAGLGGIEDRIALTVDDGPAVAAVPEADVERSKEDGKTSAVHFLHFPMTEDQAAAFKRPGAKVVLGIDHPGYGHMAMLPEEVRAALADDLD